MLDAFGGIEAAETGCDFLVEVSDLFDGLLVDGPFGRDLLNDFIDAALCGRHPIAAVVVGRCEDLRSCGSALDIAVV